MTAAVLFEKINDGVVMTTEIWKPIYGWEGLYEVSSIGRVRSIERMSRVNSLFDHRRRKMGGSIRKLAINKQGYKFVTLTGEGRRKLLSVHSLVLSSFVRPREPGECTRHLDNDPSNNNVENLMWGTHKENMGDRKKAGNYPTASKHPMSTIDEGLIDAAVFLHEILGINPSVIGRAYGISHTHIYRILNGNTGWDIESSKTRARQAMSNTSPWMHQ